MELVSWSAKGPTTKEEILEQVEPYRYSDVGKVIYAFTYGDMTGYPSKVGRFIGIGRARYSQYAPQEETRWSTA